MQISCRGWSRRMWNHRICDIDLSKGMDQYGHEPQQEEAGARVRWRSSARLSGEYVFEARFTKVDVARLFVEAFSNATLADVLSLLVEARAKRSNTPWSTTNVVSK